MSLPSSDQRLSVCPSVLLERLGCRSVGGGDLEVGVRDPFSQCSVSLRILHRPGFVFTILPIPSRGELCRRKFRLFVAVEPASLTPGYYSCMFVVTKASGGWRPIIDLSTLNLSVVKTRFRMETAQSVLRSVRRDDWMVSIDLKVAYLQIPIHPSSCKFSRFTAGKGLAVQGPLLRSVYSSAGVHMGHGSCVQLPSSVRCLDASVSGQLTDSSVFSQGILLGKGQSPESLRRPQDCHQFGEVFSRSVSVDSLSGDQDQVTDFPGFADSLEDRKVLLNSRRISVLKGAVCEVLEGPVRPPRVVDIPCPGKSRSHESSSVGSTFMMTLS